MKMLKKRVRFLRLSKITFLILVYVYKSQMKSKTDYCWRISSGDRNPYISGLHIVQTHLQSLDKLLSTLPAVFLTDEISQIYHDSIAVSM